MLKRPPSCILNLNFRFIMMAYGAKGNEERKPVLDYCATQRRIPLPLKPEEQQFAAFRWTLNAAPAACRALVE